VSIIDKTSGRVVVPKRPAGSRVQIRPSGDFAYG
jgi:hypothetical protein